MKKKTGLIIGLIICLTVIIGSIGITKYNEKAVKTETIGYYVDGVYQKEAPDANKVLFSGYTCNDDSILKWNSNTWKLEIVKFKFGTKCKVYFITKTVNEDEQIVKYYSNGYEVNKKEKKADGIELITPVRDGYDFDGWYTDPTGGEKVTPGTKVGQITGPIYARWKAKEYTITFDANGGEVSTTSEKGKYNDIISLPTPTREGYLFIGWFTEKENGIKINTPYRISTAFDTTFYAHWSKNEEPATSTNYVINYNANGGNVTPTSATVESGKTLKLPTPTREGYSFSGWFTEPSGGTVVNNTTKWFASQTIYAHWNEINVTITYNANGGSVSPTSATVKYNGTLTLPTPTRSGYNFSGWFTAASSGNQVNNTTQWTSSQTIYAHWSEIASCWKMGANNFYGYYENGVLTQCVYKDPNVSNWIAVVGAGYKCNGGSSHGNPLTPCTKYSEALGCTMQYPNDSCNPFMGQVNLYEECSTEISNGSSSLPRTSFGGGLPTNYTCP